MNGYKARSMNRLKKTALATAVANIIIYPAAMAQERDTGIEEVLVTATKREVSVQDVPLAVTAISGADLDNMEVTSILKLEKTIPGLSIRSAGNNPSAIVRGAGAAGTSDIAVPFYIDGMYLPNSAQALASFIDIERIEVLRGPQGTLFGRNTFGGLINIIPTKPSTEVLDYGLAVTAGDYSLTKYEGMINVPLGDSFALRLAGATEERDPYVENDVNPRAGLKDSDYDFLRAQFRFEPNDTFYINFGYSKFKDTANGNLSWGYKPLGVPLSRDDPSKLDPINGFLDPRVGVYQGCADGSRPGGGWQAGNACDGTPEAWISGDEFNITSEITPSRKAEEDAYYLNVGWNVADHQISLKAAQFDYDYFSFNDVDFTSLPSWGDGEFIESTNRQVDITVSSLHDSKFQYTLGAYYFDSRDDDNTYAYVFASLAETWSAYMGATPETPVWAHWITQNAGGTESKAIYAQADYSLTEKLNLTAGARYTKDDRESIQSNPLETPDWAASPPFPGVGARTFNVNSPTQPEFDYSGQLKISGNDSHDDYRLGAQYYMTDDVMLYGSWATSYIAGGIDGISGDLLDPQENETYEIGLKSDFFEGTLRLNVAIYSAEYTGFSTTVFNIEGESNVPVARQVAGGGIDSQGVEVEGFWNVSENLVADFGFAWDDSTYKDFNVASRSGTAGVDFIDASGQGWFEMDGEETPFSPEFTAAIGLTYYWSMGSLGELTPRIQGYYNSGYQTAREHTFFTEQDSYTKLDLSLAWTSQSGRLSVKAFLNNATDEVVSTSTDITPEVDGTGYTAYADYQEPRNYGVRLGYAL